MVARLLTGTRDAPLSKIRPKAGGKKRPTEKRPVREKGRGGSTYCYGGASEGLLVERVRVTKITTGKNSNPGR